MRSTDISAVTAVVVSAKRQANRVEIDLVNSMDIGVRIGVRH